MKLLDFGLAKLVSDSAGQSLTRAGEALGTLLYMSPEQLRGEAVDQRSDLWSFGVVAYEMVCGVTPFQADSNAATAVRILNDEPPSLNAVPRVPPWYAGLVAGLLKKNPAERTQSAAEVLDVLERQGIATRPPSSSGPVGERAPLASTVGAAGGARSPRKWLLAAGLVAIASMGLVTFLYSRMPQRAGRIRSLLVLPFANASANAEMEYISDGIAEDLINSLSEVPELQVIARTTAFRYKGKDLDLQKFGRDLAVDAVLTGQVQQRGDKLVVQADLVNVKTGSEVWGHRYDRPLTDILGVQREITCDISDTLRPRLTSAVQRRLSKRFSGNPEAQNLYLRGRYFWNKRTEPALARAEAYFKQAIEVDTDFAAAYSGFADTYMILGVYGYAPIGESLAKAEAAAVKAVALDAELAEARASLATIKQLQWDWATAEKEYARAIALNPNYATAHQWYALYLVAAGLPEQAMLEVKQAHQLDPASITIATSLGLALCCTGQFDRGIATLKEAVELEPAGAASTHGAMAECYGRWNKLQEALAELEKAEAIAPGRPDGRSGLGYLYAISGRRDEAQAILEELKSKDSPAKDLSSNIATVHAGLGDREQLFQWLEKAYQRRAPFLLNDLRISFVYDPYRADPRFSDLVRRIGFPR